MAPVWKDVRYQSLGPEAQKLYDAYVEAYELSRELAKKLRVAATREWMAKHPNGMNGKFISFNVNGGRMRWVLADKRPPGDYKTVGEDVPAATSLTSRQPVMSDPSVVPTEARLDDPARIKPGSLKERLRRKKLERAGKIIPGPFGQYRVGDQIENLRGHNGVWIIRQDAHGTYAEPYEG